jgi:hypothetical protein
LCSHLLVNGFNFIFNKDILSRTIRLSVSSRFPRSTHSNSLLTLEVSPHSRKSR